MNTPKLSPRRIEAFKRFITVLPHGTDVDLVILKAHLLIEEQINAIASARLSNAAILLQANGFESHYRTLLARSFFPADHMPSLWNAVKHLNKLRNKIAHTIQVEGRRDLMREVTNIFELEISNENLQEKFEFSLWLIYETVSSLVDDNVTDEPPLFHWHRAER
jgi:hypothetical protein